MVGLILGTGILVLVFRLIMEGGPGTQRTDVHTDKTLIRSWLAVALVSGLLLFAVGSLFIDDTSLWNLMMGGVIASAGTATAFYFASKASEQTQQNLLNAAFGGTGAPISLPDIKGMTVGNARKILEALKLTFMVPVGTADDQIVTGTQPPPGFAAKPGDTVTGTVEPLPIKLPDVRNRSVADARTTIEGLKLVFKTDPPGAADNGNVANTNPAAGAVVKPGDTVTATIAP
jgi:hypothetical protein